MIMYYIRHAWSMLWQEKFFTIISLLGIGLAVSFIMVIFTVNEIDDASYAPEVNRYRTLYVKNVSEKSSNGTNNSSLSPKLMKNVFYNLEGVEAVTAVNRGYSFVEARKLSGEGQNVNSICTDGFYWKFYEFEFVEGKPFTASDFDSGIRVAVITESLSRALYKGENALGKSVFIAQQPYKVVGVVKDVSPSSTFAFAKIWFPYTTSSQVMNYKNELSCGVLEALVLAKKATDFGAIKRSIESKRAYYNQSAPKDVKIILRGPDTHSEERFRGDASKDDSEYKEVVKLWAGIIVILIIVPAFNMTSFTISRMKKRQEELGLRRSFGALRSDIVGQVIAENMVLTFIGGLLGFLLSVGMLFAFQGTLFPEGIDFSFSMFFRPTTLCYLIGICVIINLISASIPAIRSANQPILKALKEKKS
jgi:ABC-type antimicrobial peptide transport system permease subunit